MGGRLILGRQLAWIYDVTSTLGSCNSIEVDPHNFELMKGILNAIRMVMTARVLDL